MLGLTLLMQNSPAQRSSETAFVDSDSDGISDTTETALLKQFLPEFLIASADCSAAPAEFRTGILAPQVAEENSTIYAQVSPFREAAGNTRKVEIHYYHLWRRDCGRHSHPLDAEHVSVLVQAPAEDANPGQWKATHWYAAAHEDTVCDISQIARASTLHAEEKGPRVWISPGKHASYLDPSFCRQGCGADRCEHMKVMVPGKLINVGEPEHPTPDLLFTRSSAWPLPIKMRKSDFPPPAVARVDRLPSAQIAWFHEGRHPSQGVIAISSTTQQAILMSGDHATGALSSASDATAGAVDAAQNSTGNALQKSYHNTTRALGTTMRNVGKALDTAEPQNNEQQKKELQKSGKKKSHDPAEATSAKQPK